MWHPATAVGIWRPSPGRRGCPRASYFFRWPVPGRPRRRLAAACKVCAVVGGPATLRASGTPVAVEVFPDLPSHLAYGIAPPPKKERMARGMSPVGDIRILCLRLLLRTDHRRGPLQLAARSSANGGPPTPHPPGWMTIGILTTVLWRNSAEPHQPLLPVRRSLPRRRPVVLRRRRPPHCRGVGSGSPSSAVSKPTVRLASDCTGLNAAGVALEVLGFDVVSVVASEIDEKTALSW